jgi:hypothetical protein
MVWDCLIVGLLWLHHIEYLANVTVTTTACNLLQGKNDIKAGMLPWQPELLVYCRAKPSYGCCWLLSIDNVWIFFEPLGTFSLNLVGR